MARSRYSLVKKKKIKVMRKQGATTDRVTGYPIASQEITFDIEGHYYPLDDYRKMLLPEAQRNRGAKRLHTPIEYLLRTTEESSRADLVELDGAWYEVNNRETFTMGVLDHHEYLLLKVETTGGASHVVS